MLNKDMTTPPGPYAILSYTWGADDEEVTFDDLEHKTGEGKIGYANLWFCANQARKDGLEYFWVDTCCDGSNLHIAFEGRVKRGQSNGDKSSVR